MKHSVAIVDDHHIVRSGLVAAVNGMDEYEVTMEAGNGKEFMDEFRSTTNPEIVIIDLNMPVMNGYETMELLKERAPEVKTLALTVDATDDALVKAIRAGARGFIRKTARPALFKAALDSLVLTGYFHNEDIHSTYLNNPTLKTKEEKEKEELLEQITPRELEFLKHVCNPDELTYDQIADEMDISRRTIDYYRQELFEKFNIKSKTGLVLFAIRWKLVEF